MWVITVTSMLAAIRDGAGATVSTVARPASEE